jgi:hypothetical protein
MIYTGTKYTNSAFAQKTKAAFISAEDHDFPFNGNIFSKRMTTSPLRGQAPIAHKDVVGSKVQEPNKTMVRRIEAGCKGR